MQLCISDRGGVFLFWGEGDGEREEAVEGADILIKLVTEIVANQTKPQLAKIARATRFRGDALYALLLTSEFGDD